MNPLPLDEVMRLATVTARRFALDEQRARNLVTLLHSVPLRTAVRLNRNQRTLLSLRGQRHGGWTVSLHVSLLDHPVALADIPAWVGTRGRVSSPTLRQTLQTVWSEQHRIIVSSTEEPGPLPPMLQPLGAALDLEVALGHVHRTWFPQLSRPAIAWGKASHRRLSHIRFGSYRRAPSPLIRIHPRLGRPWIARAFIEHVLFHELCHHAQACSPLRSEPAHSPRFRAWERSYPHHDLALSWERQHLVRLLEI